MKTIAGYRKSGPSEIAASITSSATVSCTLRDIPGAATVIVIVSAHASAAANSCSITGNAQLGSGSNGHERCELFVHGVDWSAIDTVC